MRIEHHTHKGSKKETLRSDFARAYSASQYTGRPCGTTCTRTCDICGSSACTHMCSRNCPLVATTLTSDPVKFPLEDRIAPLVYEMKKTGVFETCWSCEGHTGLDGKVWKLPQVWFYIESVTHVRLLADSIKTLRFRKKLKHTWQIVVTFSDDENPETTFSLEPVPEEARCSTMKALQDDIDVLAENLNRLFAERARELVQLI